MNVWFFASVLLLGSVTLNAAETSVPLLIIHPSGASADRAASMQVRSALEPGNVTFRELPAASRTITLKDTLDFTPGVLAQPRNGAEALRLSVRGSGQSRTFQGRGLLLLQDGVPLNAADGGFDMAAFNPALVDYTLLRRGGNALTDGAATLGGSVFFGTADVPEERLVVQGGSFGTRQLTVRRGNAYGSLGLSLLGQDGWREQNRHSAGYFRGRVNWRSADKRAGQGLMLWLSQQNAEIPGTLRKAAVDQDGRQANFLNRRGRFERNVDTATLAHSGQWRNRQWTIDSTLYATGRWLDSPVTTVISTDGVDTGLRLKGERLGTRGILTVGGNIAHGRADEQRWRNNLGTPGAPVLTRTLGAVSAEGFAQYQYSLTRSVDVLAGVQGLYASRTLEDSTPVLQRQDSRYYALNPRVGILYNLGTAQWFTNLSRSAEPPTWNELSGGNEPGFTPLGLQTAVTVETGLRGKWQEGWRWELALWRSRLRDELFTFRFPDGRFPDGRTVTANALKTRKQGVELGVEGRVLPSLTVKLAYTLQQGNFVNDALYGDNTLPGLPEHVVQAAVAYTPVAGFILTPRVEWVPLGYPVDNTGTLDTDGYALAGLQAEWVVTSGFTVLADARNLFDSPYIATTNIIPDAGGADQSQFFPGEGRAVYAGVVWRW